MQQENWKLRDQVQACDTKRDIKRLKGMGLDVEKPDSKNGEVSINYDWKKIEKYQKEEMHWFRHESKEHATQEIAKHLNKAAKLMVNDIAAGQVKAVKDSAKLIGAFARWAEPECNCDAHALVTCLQGEGVKHGNPFNFHHDKRHTLKSKCAKDTGCHLKGWGKNRPYKKAVKHDEHKVDHAMKHMMKEVDHDFRKEMKDQ